VTARDFTVECAVHGEMTHDSSFMGWACTDARCGAWLPDSEVRRLVTGAPASSPDPVPLVVT
jgi:hypothetical protein